MIRQYTPADADAIIAVWYAASKLATPFLQAAFLAQERDNIRNLYLPNTETWVLEEKDEVIGFTSLVHHDDGKVEVGAIFLDPGFHGCGYGTLMMNHVIAHYATVSLDVFSENTIGRRFYDRYGFRFVSEYRHDQTDLMMTRLVYP